MAVLPRTSPQTANNEPSSIGVKYESIRNEFTKDLGALDAAVRGADEGYNPSDVNTVLEKTKRALLAPVPPDDKPFRTYVNRVYPGPVGDTTAVVPKDVAQQKFTRVDQLLQSLSHVDSLRVSLTIITRPEKARFELVPLGAQKIATTTNSQLTNIYRGEYRYTIKKQGFKDVDEQINFIERAGNILECELEPNNSPEAALPCKLR